MGGPALLVIDNVSGSERDAANIMDQAVERLADLEARYSRYRSDSLICEINSRAGSGVFTPLDTEAAALFDLAGQLWRESEGLFDITSGPLRHAWNFESGATAAPERIDHLLALIGYQYIDWQGSSCHLKRDGMEVDLGGIAKEYAVDTVAALFRGAGVTSGLVELAGDVAVIGAQGDQTAWKIGIKNPANQGSLCSVALVDAALATSGNYARTITLNGQRYGHLLDPRSGWPVSGPDSVSVIDAHCLTAGAAATVACLKTHEAALDWLSQSQLPWLMCSQGDAPIGPIAESLTTVTPAWAPSCHVKPPIK